MKQANDIHASYACVCLLPLQVVASMEIQEITRNREKFVQEIERVSNCICVDGYG